MAVIRKIPLFASGILTLVMAHCSALEPSGGKRKTGNAVPVAEDVKKEEPVKASAEVSYKAFEETVFPLLTEHCGSCHGVNTSPKFAIADDVAKSHDETIESKKVNFEDPEASRLFLRIKTDFHNCWSDCDENGATMLLAIKAWGAEVAASTGGPKLVGKVSTPKVKLSAIRSIKVGTPGDLGLLAFEAESIIPTAPFILKADPLASGAQGISSDTGGAPAGDMAALHLTDTALGTLTYNVYTEEAGFYKIYGNVKGPAAGINDFYVQIDDKVLRTWDIIAPPTFHWQELGFVEEPNVVQLFELTKGDHKVIIKQGQIGAVIDKIIISKTIIPKLEAVVMNPLNYPSLTFDLSALFGAPASFHINLIQTVGNAFTVQNPALINNTGRGIKVRGIYPLVNGLFTEQNALYSTVDTVAKEGLQILSESGSVFLLGKGDGVEDPDITFSFDVLELTDLPPVQ
jgi:hypothetical protein